MTVSAPEPLDATTRLTITVEGTPTQLVPNVDETRVIVTRAGGGTWPLHALAVEMTWRRDAGAAVPVLSVSGNKASETVSVEVIA